MKLLRETQINAKTSYIEEKSGQGKKLFIEGPTLVYDKVNANRRLYPKDILSQAIKNHIISINEGACVGELMHPSQNPADIDYDRLSHKFTEVNDTGECFVTKALVLDTDKGLQLQKIYEGGVKIGISSRAFGDVLPKNGVSVIETLNIVSLGDIVHNPSAPGAYVQGVMERKEWIFESGKIICLDISETIDKHKSIIEKANRKDISRISRQLFIDYIKKINL